MNRISKEAEVAVFKEFQDGNDDAFTQIFNQFRTLALSVMYELTDTAHKHLRTDLESDVNLVLWRAAKNFDLAKGNRFSSYLRKCLSNEIRRGIKAWRKQRGNVDICQNEVRQVSSEDVNTDGEPEVPVTDRFPCCDEPILSELTPFCKGEKQARLLETICTDERIWFNNNRVNCTAIGRRLGTTGEAVRQTISNLRSNQSLKSTLCELLRAKRPTPR